MSCIERLECTFNNYAWGKLGHHSEVARLFAAGHEEAATKIVQGTPYSELWIGTHPDGPAVVRSNRLRLSEHLSVAVEESNHVHLPYIMKVMSINHTLSLQVHPTKEQAVELNRKDPHNYPDQNHKPELAYALSRFELLCGFRPAREIVRNMEAFPELYQAMGFTNCKNFIGLNKLQLSDESPQMIAALKKCFTHMMSIGKENVNQLLLSLFRRIKKQQNAGETLGALRADTMDVMRDMFKRFPNDIGCLSPLFLNHIVLEPGECVYYGAQELHAYLSGECIECVSCSNNTIRAGLTNKFVDRENLLQILNYRMTEPSFYYVHPQQVTGHPHVKEFAPEDCRDFTLQTLEFNADKLENEADKEQMQQQHHQFPIDLPALGCSSTFVLVEAENLLSMELTNRNGYIDGQAQMTPGDSTFMAKRGDIFYIPPWSTLRFMSAHGHIKGFRTYSFEKGPDHSTRILAQPLLKKINDDIAKEACDMTDEEQDFLSSVKKKEKTKKQLLNVGCYEIYDIETEMDGFL